MSRSLYIGDYIHVDRHVSSAPSRKLVFLLDLYGLWLSSTLRAADIAVVGKRKDSKTLSSAGQFTQQPGCTGFSCGVRNQVFLSSVYEDVISQDMTTSMWPRGHISVL